MASSFRDEATGSSAGGGGSNNASHPGTSGRSPPPPRGAATSAASAAGGGGAGSHRHSGRPSIGSTTTGTGAVAAGRPSIDHHHHHYQQQRPGRLSHGSAMHGMRLSYGSSALGSGAAAAASIGGMTPINHSLASSGGGGFMSPPSTASTVTNSNVHSQSDFFAALSPVTARYLRGQEPLDGGGGAGATAGEARGTAASATTGVTGGASGMPPLTPRSASKAAAAALLNAANAAKGIDGDEEGQNMNRGSDDSGNGNDEQQQQQRGIPPINSHSIPIGQDTETVQLRLFVQSLLGMQLPATTANNTAAPAIPLMTTPDPATASFYATSLLTKTSVATPNGRTWWRPDDAYLAARALSLKGEHKRAIWILDRVGLIGFGMGNGDNSAGTGVNSGEGDVGGGVAVAAEFANDNPSNHSARYNSDGDARHHLPAISNEEGIRNALLLRAESALLAGQCLVQAGEYERALTVYEEAMRFPPPPPPSEWGMYGYGYRLDGFHRANNNGVIEEEGEVGFDAKLADEMYIRTWREQSLSHMALIDDGDDERLLQLAANIRRLPFSNSPISQNTSSSETAATMATEGIHPIARLCAARGIAYDEISNPHRAVPFLRMALAIDARCMEALDYVIRRRLLTPEEEKEWISSLNFGNAGELGGMGISWLRDAYLARLRGSGAGLALPPTATETEDVDGEGDILGASSPVVRSDVQSPSMLSLGSPDFAGGAGKHTNQAATSLLPTDPFSNKPTTPASHTVDEAFRSLATRHALGKSPDVLAHAAIRSHASHDLRSALAYCTAIDAVDPFCRTAGYVHVATLVGLGLKRRLFQLAHRLVDTDPKDALAWFAVGSYYYACGRYDLAQRHFSRSTRLDPSSAECWIGFGCSFAVCDESDQALASFRAAQNKYAGSHVPLLYMGMEYLRTNHLSLAGHFLTSAQRTDPSDPLCCNELGVWSYRQGDNMEDAAFWFVKALRLHVRAEGSALTSVDEALGMNGYILLNGHEEEEGDGGGDAHQDATARNSTEALTPHVKRQSSNNNEMPPMSTVLCAAKTPSGQSIAASMFSHDEDTSDGGLTDTECVERCMDQFWEPTIFNLGQAYRKMKRYRDAIVCFEKCSSLNPGNYAAYAALGFAKHLSNDVDGAIDSYHEALSRKPEDPFTSEMLTRALAEAVTYPPSLAMLSSFPPSVEEGGGKRSRGIGSSILKNMDLSFGKKNQQQHGGIQHGNNDYQNASMFTSNSNDVDMSLTLA